MNARELRPQVPKRLSRGRPTKPDTPGPAATHPAMIARGWLLPDLARLLPVHAPGLFPLRVRGGFGMVSGAAAVQMRNLPTDGVGRGARGMVRWRHGMGSPALLTRQGPLFKNWTTAIRG